MTGRDVQFIAIGVMLSGLALVLVGVIGYVLGWTWVSGYNVAARNWREEPTMTMPMPTRANWRSVASIVRRCGF